MRTLDFEAFRTRLYRAAARSGSPVRMVLELTYRCNFSCGHCYVPAACRHSWPEMDGARLRRLIDEINATGCFFLVVTGGEPLLRPDVFDVLHYAASKGMQLVLNTNGALLDAAAVKELARLKLNKLEITLPSVSEDIFARITGAPGAWAKVSRAIESARRAGIPLVLKTCLLKYNYAELPAIKSFVRSYGAAHKVDHLVYPCFDGSTAPYAHAASVEELVRDLGPVKDLVEAGAAGCPEAPRRSRRSQVSDMFMCGAGQQQGTVTPDGKLKICPQVSYPAVPCEPGRFAEAWHAMRAQVRALKRTAPACAACRYRSFCRWCPGRGWLTAGSFHARDPHCCGFSEALARRD